MYLNYSDENIEEDAFYKIEETLVHHYESHQRDNTTTQNEHAEILERKLPQNSQLLSVYMDRKRTELGPGQDETVWGQRTSNI
jgi:hypothetical protein